MNYKNIAFLAFITFYSIPLLFSKPIGEKKISYQDKNYIVPKHQVWKLSWKSPYKPDEITPAYDVRVLGKLFGKQNKAQIREIIYDDEIAFDINATKNQAIIWLGSGTEFYLANDLIKVNVEIYMQ